MKTENAIAIIGGSGLDQLPGFHQEEELFLETPFGAPSDVIRGGEFQDRSLYFLPRHGRGHRIAPHEINHRANLYALRSLGVRWILSVTAVGSLQERHRPREVVLIDQFFDRMSGRADHTFFGNGIVAHVSLADPICPELRACLAEACRKTGAAFHDGGTYVNMDGPAFSTRAESETYRQLGFDVIGMTNFPEAKLAREAEMSLATLAMVTDYDCWKTGEAPVTAGAIYAHLQANAETARAVIAEALPLIPRTPDWPAHRSLENALATPRNYWPEKTVQNLSVILSRFV
ncbi:MAG TPA: S-methyl-5'-thioadenosine phosphorylase [Chthoniobacterales bacterium]